MGYLREYQSGLCPLPAEARGNGLVVPVVSHISPKDHGFGVFWGCYLATKRHSVALCPVLWRSVVGMGILLLSVNNGNRSKPRHCTVAAACGAPLKGSLSWLRMALAGFAAAAPLGREDSCRRLQKEKKRNPSGHGSAHR